MTSSVLENEEVKNIIEGTHDLDILKTVLKNSIDKEDIISKWTFSCFMIICNCLKVPFQKNL